MFFVLLGKTLLARCLHVCEMDFVKAADLLKVNVDTRSKHDNLFKDRDYHEELVKAARKVL